MPGAHTKRHVQGLPWPIYTTFSLAPLLVIVIAVAALVFGQEAAQGKIVTEIQGVVGKESAQAIQAMIEKARAPAAGLFATVLSLMTLLIGATGVVGEFKDTLNPMPRRFSSPPRVLAPCGRCHQEAWPREPERAL